MIEFAESLIKGKIAEVVFEQMIREEGRYDVIPFGYEHTMPMLAQYNHLTQVKRVMSNIKDAPDFALISADKTEVYLVEVKYRTRFVIEEVIGHAQNLLKRWDPSWLFVATPQQFYCTPCSSVVNAQKMTPLSENWVKPDIQTAYLELLNRFEK